MDYSLSFVFSSKHSVKFGFKESNATIENETIEKKEVLKIKKIELI